MKIFVKKNVKCMSSAFECVGVVIARTHTGKAENDPIFNSALGITYIHCCMSFSIAYNVLAMNSAV